MEYLSTQEVADKLSVSYLSVYYWIRDGVLPAYKFRRAFRISVTDLDKFIRDKKVKNKKVVVK
ncbi:hypothetical protein ES705_08091 [subsurface metagenome]